MYFFVVRVFMRFDGILSIHQGAFDWFKWFARVVSLVVYPVFTAH